MAGMTAGDLKEELAPAGQRSREGVPGQSQPRPVSYTVTIERTVSEELAREFYALYLETFADLTTSAVARHVLHEDEFMAEMFDERIDKYVAWDNRGRAAAMCTLTNHLETVPWISPQYFAHHYPEHTARGAVYYLGFVLVAHEHRRGYVFVDLVRRFSETLLEERAMCGYDFCSFNNDVLGLPDAIGKMLAELGDISVLKLDTQTYYAAIAHGPHKMPGMLPRSRSRI
jgi:hypothetical protein